MTTLQNFTRITDPIMANDLDSKIFAATGKVVATEITPSDVLVRGDNISESDRTAIQLVITQYYYPSMQFGIPVSDNPDMSADRHNTSISEHAAYTANSAVSGSVGKLQTSSGVVYGVWPYPFSATTNASGVATAYLTSDGTSGGTAAYTTVYMPSVTPIPVGANNYQPTSISLSGDKKTLTITINQIAPVLGILTLTSAAPAGITVQGIVYGK